ncbi:hypothetical protein MXMO3_00917 [Maritalea myrionectae]|uniref:Uncharacterized protein n=1 Tax=Maritalea myrionectae TaxID=454601 RepID=A0A2R4MBN9_9HYPH|nr:AAA family ATPase [Maritalea myrionectae]AVX03448.1 hypothetical protein MXMO3_00917 [Maritalea myrionectae]
MRIKSNKVKIDEAVEHILWCVQWQADGHIPIRVMRKDDQGALVPLVTQWFNNRDPKLKRKLKSFLSQHAKGEMTVLYSPVAFSKKEAKAKYALSSQIAFVDADGAKLAPGMPEPTRTINSSKANQHWFWLLSEAAEPAALQRINRALTRLAKGDKGGHSPAKLFRLPGFMNTKYEPPIRVRLYEDTGEVLETSDLLKLADQTLETDLQSVTIDDDVVSKARTIKPNSVWEKYRKKLNVDIRKRIKQKTVFGQIQLGSGPSSITYPGDDRSDIIWAIGCELRRGGATPAEVLALLFSTVFWKSRDADGKAEDPERLIQRVFDADFEPERCEPSDTADLEVKQPASLLNAIDPSLWDGQPVPVRQWIIKDWIPLLKTTILYGDGGTGKTLLVLMLAVACALGIDFLGKKVAQGRVYAFLGENDDDDTHITLNDVCAHYDVGLGDLRGKARIASRAGFDNVLMHFMNGKGIHTELFDALVQDVVAFDADLIIIETAADLFGGNENIRSEVRQFVARCCEQLAVEANAAVVLCAHPSVAGVKSGDGSSGSTAWNNSARSRLYLHRVIDAQGHELDPDHRVLSRKKSNFARSGDAINIYWQSGVFITSRDARRIEARSKADATILAEVHDAFDKGRPWSPHHQSGHRYLINWMVSHLNTSKHAAKKQLGRLLTDGRLVEVEYDTHNHKRGLCTHEQATNLSRNNGDK